MVSQLPTLPAQSAYPEGSVRLRSLSHAVAQYLEQIGPYGRVLWISGFTTHQRRLLLTAYGPTLKDVERNLKVRLHYAKNAPPIRYDVAGMIAYALTQTGCVSRVLRDYPPEDEELFFRLYFVCFGLRRVTYTQVSAVMQALHDAGLAVPQRNAWSYRTRGYSEFIRRYLDWLKQSAHLYDTYRALGLTAPAEVFA